MRQAGDGRHGRRMRGLTVVLWRAGVRIHEALTLTETDLNERRGSLLIRRGKGDRRREIGMDPWAWSVLNDWTVDRAVLPPGPLFCVIDGPTRGRAWSATAVRAELRHLAAEAGVRRRFARTSSGMRTRSSCYTRGSAAADPAPTRARVPRPPAPTWKVSPRRRSSARCTPEGTDDAREHRTRALTTPGAVGAPRRSRPADAISSRIAKEKTASPLRCSSAPGMRCRSLSSCVMPGRAVVEGCGPGTGGVVVS